jgi:hypothetical protein
MANKDQPEHDPRTEERRTPVKNDIDPDGMDSESEGDELEAGGGDPAQFDDGDDGVEPDGVREAPDRAPR